MIALHESLAGRIAQIRALAAQRLREQKPRHARQAQRGGMELIKLHVGDFGAGAPCHRDAVTSGYRGIGGIAVDLAGAAAGQQDGARMHRTDLAILDPAACAR